MVGHTAGILPRDWSVYKSGPESEGDITVSSRPEVAWLLLRGVEVGEGTGLAAADLPDLELGEGPVRGLGEVGHGEAVGLVGPQPLHPAHHPVVVLGLGRLGHVLRRPAAVPLAPLLVLPRAHTRVRLQIILHVTSKSVKLNYFSKAKVIKE